MKIATQCALAGGLLLAGIAHACANPVEIEICTAPGGRDCDVSIAQPSEFGADASVPAQGGSAGNGSNPAPSGGAGSSNEPPLGGNAGSGSAGSGSTFGGTAGSGSVLGNGGNGGGSSGGAGGSGSAGTGSAGTGSAGTGSAGTGSAGTGSAGTGSQSNFELDSCDLDNLAGCEEFACDTACPAAGAGNYCRANCPTIVDCVTADPSCITEADPMCGTPSQNPFTPNQCTSQVGNSGSPTQAGTPANVALALINCLCSDPRP